MARPFLRDRFFSLCTLLIFFLQCIGLTLLVVAQGAQSTDPLSVRPTDRIGRSIDDGQPTTLRGNVHPLATAEFDQGKVAPDFPMEKMVLTLTPSAEQAAALDQLVEEQQNPESAYYHQWLTPEQFGEHFGVSDVDLTQIGGWLEGHGLGIEEVSAGRLAITFSGTAAQVESAFRTEIHTYKIGDAFYHANASDPEIPVALAPIVAGVVSLHDFHSQSMHNARRKPLPEFTSGGSHYLAPADFATIYDLGPAYQEGLNGREQTVAIVGRSNIRLSDVEQFRAFTGLPANNPQVIVNGPDPGIFSADEETEADLDVEWSGAVAPGAAIKFVVSKSTNTSDGVDLSAQYIVDHNLAPVMSTSFGLCEAALGTSGNSFLNSLWQQAAAEGITVLVSAGDSGAAGCDSPSATSASHGLGVNGICSTPYSTCVGGSEFDDANAVLYWSATSNPSNEGSALSYIPESAWNESNSGGLWAGGGGASKIYAKPSWQSGAGVPADAKRDVPDVSLTAAGHDGYIIEQEGSLYIVGGTSAASPSFAGIMALVLQNEGSKVGNANTVLYPLAARQTAGGAAVFHDITSGSNSVPGVTGFSARSGYDQATGLGSVDGAVLVNHWADGTSELPFHLAASANSIGVTAGSSSSMTFHVTAGNGFNSAVAFSITGLPSGVTATFSPGTIATGAGSTTLKLMAASTAKAANATATVIASSGSTRQQCPVTVTVTVVPKTGVLLLK